MTDDERWKQWNEWLETILEDVQNALIYRTIFQEVRAMIDANPRIQKSSSFYEWMAGVYADSGLMAVRRQVDLDGRAVSLRRLLIEVRKNPQVLSRAVRGALSPRHAGCSRARVRPLRRRGRSAR